MSLYEADGRIETKVNINTFYDYNKQIVRRRPPGGSRDDKERANAPLIRATLRRFADSNSTRTHPTGEISEHGFNNRTPKITTG